MTDSKLNRIQQAALSLIGLVCLGYFKWGRQFAELHLTLPVIHFPVFIGEILLGICLFLFALNWRNHLAKITFDLTGNQRMALLFFYTSFALFICIKAFFGYVEFKTPLAFRHAALFYYPVFFLFGVAFFNREYFQKNIILGAVVCFALIFLSNNFFRPLFFVASMLIGILYFGYRSRLRNILFLFFLVIYPFKKLLYVSRTELVSTAMSIAVVLFLISLVVKARRELKYGILIFVILFFSVGILMSRNNNNLKSMFCFDKIQQSYSEHNEIIQAKKRDFVFPPLDKVKIFNAEANLSNAFFKSVSDFDKSGRSMVPPLVEKTSINKSGTIPKVIEKNQGIIAPIKSPQSNVSSTGISKKVARHDSSFAGSIPQNALTSRLTYVKEDVAFHQAQIQEQIIQKIKDKFRIDVTQDRDLRTKFEKILKLRTFVEKDNLIPILAAELKLENPDEISLLRAFFQERSEAVGINNVLFRLLVWKDAWEDLIEQRAFLGIPFGTPFRSENIEIVGWARGEWSRDGWLAMHNSYSEMIYRGGIIGLLLICSLWLFVIFLAIQVLKQKVIVGIFMVGALTHWLCMGCLGVIFELPYHAIPFYSLAGMSLAYIQTKIQEKI